MHVTIEIGLSFFFFLNLVLCFAALVKDESSVLLILTDLQDSDYHQQWLFHDKDSKKHSD